MQSVLLVIILGASFAYAQQSTTPSSNAPGCGPKEEKFSVTTTKDQHPTTEPGPGKALLYVIQDDTHYEARPRPTNRVGVDGKWIGATHSDSYLYSSLDPGEHHLCVGWQSSVNFGKGHQAAALHFIAEEGKSYYFRIKGHMAARARSKRYRICSAGQR